MGVCVLENLSRIFLSEWSLLHLWVMRVYIVWVKGKEFTHKNPLGRMFRDCLAGRPYPRDACENDSLARLFNFQSCAPHMLNKAIVLYWLHVRMIICFAIWSLWSFPYDCYVLDQVVHMFHNMFTWSHFTYYIILILLSLDLPWGSNVFCASVSGYKYICSKCYTASRFRCEWVLPLFPNSRLSLELWFTTMCYVGFIPWQKVL